MSLLPDLNTVRDIKTTKEASIETEEPMLLFGHSISYIISRWLYTREQRQKVVNALPL